MSAWMRSCSQGGRTEVRPQRGPRQPGRLDVVGVMSAVITMVVVVAVVAAVAFKPSPPPLHSPSLRRRMRVSRTKRLLILCGCLALIGLLFAAPALLGGMIALAVMVAIPAAMAIASFKPTEPRLQSPPPPPPTPEPFWPAGTPWPPSAPGPQDARW